MVSSTPPIFRGKGEVGRQGGSKTSQEKKYTQTSHVGFLLIVKGLKYFTPVLPGFRCITGLPQLEELLHISQTVDSSQLTW